MSDSSPQSSPDDARKTDEIPAQTVPQTVPITEQPGQQKPAVGSPETAPAAEIAEKPPEKTKEELEETIDPELRAVAQADDRAGFKFLAIGFAIFFAIIAICAGVVALVMKSMGI